MKTIEVEAWAVTVDPTEARDLCVSLDLLEVLQHGDNEYVRFTQKGFNVLAALTFLLHMQADSDPEDILRGS